MPSKCLQSIIWGRRAAKRLRSLMDVSIVAFIRLSPYWFCCFPKRLLHEQQPSSYPDRTEMRFRSNSTISRPIGLGRRYAMSLNLKCDRAGDDRTRRHPTSHLALCWHESLTVFEFPPVRPGDDYRSALQELPLRRAPTRVWPNNSAFHVGSKR